MSFFGVLAIGGTITHSNAQSSAWTYQGSLISHDGPVDGLVTLRFGLFPLALGGTAVATVTNTQVTVTGGLFTTQLDFGSDLFDGSGYWLEVSLQPENSDLFTTLVPRQHLLATPYALLAHRLSEPLSGSALQGAYPEPVQLSNPNNQFIGFYQGDASGLTNIIAQSLTGLGPDAFWQLGGNMITGGQVLGTRNKESLILEVHDRHALRFEPDPFGFAAPNIVGGYLSNSVATAVFGATINGGGATRGLSSYYEPNHVRVNFGTVNGGVANNAGRTNQAHRHDHAYATVGGGAFNTAQGNSATVGGGWRNETDGYAATVAGGSDNAALGYYTSLGGGNRNTAQGRFATIGGGQHNEAHEEDSTIGGGRLNVINPAARQGTISGGTANTVNGLTGTVSGGSHNTAGGQLGTVGGGSGNMAGAGSHATVGGGLENMATGDYAIIPGGIRNVATTNAFAAGSHARAQHTGAFVWADDSMLNPFFRASFSSIQTNEFAVRATGGVRLVTGLNDQGEPAAGISVPAGGTGWSVNSDRNMKENVEAVDGKEVLKHVAAMPISSWNMKSQAPSIRHIGPMAQDFHAAFGLGESDRRINTVDADGVALAAIQGLHELVNEQKEALRKKDIQIECLIRRLDSIEAKLGE